MNQGDERNEGNKRKKQLKGLSSIIPDQPKLNEDGLFNKIKIDYLNSREIDLEFYEKKIFDQSYFQYKEFFDGYRSDSTSQRSPRAEEKFQTGSQRSGKKDGFGDRDVSASRDKDSSSSIHQTKNTNNRSSQKSNRKIQAGQMVLKQARNMMVQFVTPKIRTQRMMMGIVKPILKSTENQEQKASTTPEFRTVQEKQSDADIQDRKTVRFTNEDLIMEHPTYNETSGSDQFGLKPALKNSKNEKSSKDFKIRHLSKLGDSQNTQSEDQAEEINSQNLDKINTTTLLLKQDKKKPPKRISILEDPSQELSSDEEQDSKNLKKQVLETEKERKFAKLKIQSKKLPPVPQVKDLLRIQVSKEQKIPMINQIKGENEREEELLENIDMKTRMKRFQDHLLDLKKNIKKMTGKSVEQFKQERKFQGLKGTNDVLKHRKDSKKNVTAGVKT